MPLRRHAPARAGGDLFDDPGLPESCHPILNTAHDIDKMPPALIS
eukprot:gene9894-2660_t